MRDQGELVKRGNINEEGDVEFWEEGSEGRKRDTLAALLKPVNEEAGEEDQETRTAKGAFMKKHGVHQMGNLKRRE